MNTKGFTLDGLVNAIEKNTKVVQIKDLEPNQTFVVIVEDETEYDITIIEPQEGSILIKGGQFSEPTKCRLNGSTMGGSMLWMGRIVLGMCMEISWNGNVLTTLPVKIIGWRIDPTAIISRTVQ